MGGSTCKESENRGFERLRIPLNIDAVVGEKIIQSKILDISSSGLFINISGKFKIGASARVVFAIPDYNKSRPIKLHGKGLPRKLYLVSPL